MVTISDKERVKERWAEYLENVQINRERFARYFPEILPTDCF